MIKGFVLDDERWKQGKTVFGKDYFDDLLERIREIRASERRFYQNLRPQTDRERGPTASARRATLDADRGRADRGALSGRPPPTGPSANAMRPLARRPPTMIALPADRACTSDRPSRSAKLDATRLRTRGTRSAMPRRCP